MWWAECRYVKPPLADHPRVGQQVLKRPEPWPGGARADAERRESSWDDYAGWCWRGSSSKKRLRDELKKPLLVRPLSSIPHLDRPTNTAISCCRPEPATGLTWMAPDLIDLRMLAKLFYSQNDVLWLCFC